MDSSDLVRTNTYHSFQTNLIDEYYHLPIKNKCMIMLQNIFYPFIYDIQYFQV